MRIRIEDIKDEGLYLEFEEEVEAFPILEEMTKAAECEFLAPIRTYLRAFRVRNMIEVEGKVETLVRLTCSRCLKEFESTLKNRFALTYTHELPEVGEESGKEGVELSAEEMGLIVFHGEEIDLQDGIQEQVVMAFPQRPLCAEACKGLCPQCGADLNEGDCGCTRASFNDRFAALKDFKVRKKNK